MRDLARFLITNRGKNQWSRVDIHDLEAFLATGPKSRERRLTVLRQYFRFAQNQRLVLIDPSKNLSANGSNAFRGRTLTLDQQRELFRRWTTDTDVHPHEALVGMLALLHGASSQEARLLQIDDIDHHAQTCLLGNRPHPVPLDPASWAALQRCLAHRDQQRTTNPHVLVTKGTKAGRGPASRAYLSHVLDDCGISPRMIRSTRLVDLVNTMDPKLVATAFGMDPQVPLIYLADHVDAGRLPNPTFRRSLTHVRRNMCALENDWLEAMAMLLVSSRSVSTWNSSSAPAAIEFHVLRRRRDAVHPFGCRFSRPRPSNRTCPLAKHPTLHVNR